MALLASHRRPWALIVFVVLLVPFVGFCLSGHLSASLFPKAWWQHPARKLGPVLEANYGFRAQILEWHGRYRHALRSPSTANVFYGEGGQLFYGAEKALEQSTGVIFRKQNMDRFVSMASRLNKSVTKYGGKLIVSAAPNAQTILSEALPAWARRANPERLEHDYVFDEMTKTGLTALDLRPLLVAAKEDGPVYQQTDTHWNNRGALLAFNAVMRAAARPDLQIPPDVALNPMKGSSGGDLAVLLGLSRALKEPFHFPWKPEFLAQRRRLKRLPPVPGHEWNYAFEKARLGPSMLVIGDSFTARLWRPLLASISRRSHWIHIQDCGFSWDDAEKVGAELVILLPTERFLGCPGSSWPKGLPEPAAPHGIDPEVQGAGKVQFKG
jgi:hypothetical protein